MSCTFPQELLEAVISFHGHSCPGLAIGIRAAEYALQKLPDVQLADLVCVTETDMCGVDGIQFLTKCTVGKGNLIHRDYGKAAFSFYDRNSGEAFRLVFRSDARGKDGNTSATSREDMMRRFMTLSLPEMFTLEKLTNNPPRRARILHSITCAHCKEETMESRTRRFDGETLCIPCFDKVEQKI